MFAWAAASLPAHYLRGSCVVYSTKISQTACKRRICNHAFVTCAAAYGCDRNMLHVTNSGSSQHLRCFLPCRHSQTGASKVAVRLCLSILAVVARCFRSSILLLPGQCAAAIVALTSLLFVWSMSVCTVCSSFLCHPIGWNDWQRLFKLIRRGHCRGVGAGSELSKTLSCRSRGVFHWRGRTV